MTDALIEKVARAVFDHWDNGLGVRFYEQPDLTIENQRDAAKVAILAVLDHFSEPGNVTDGMEGAAGKWATKKNIAAAMRAALDELRGGT